MVCGRGAGGEWYIGGVRVVSDIYVKGVRVVSGMWEGEGGKW